MTDLQAAVETIYRARGYEWCRHRRQPSNVPVVSRYLLPAEHANKWEWWTILDDVQLDAYPVEHVPDPLADTPEGAFEWVKIMEWAIGFHPRAWFKAVVRAANALDWMVWAAPEEPRPEFRGLVLMEFAADALGKGD